MQQPLGGFRALALADLTAGLNQIDTTIRPRVSLSHYSV